MARFTKWDFRLANRIPDADIGRFEVKAVLLSMSAISEAPGGLLQNRDGLQLRHQMADVQAARQQVDT